MQPNQQGVLKGSDGQMTKCFSMIKLINSTALLIILTGCNSLPDNSNRTISHYLPANPNTQLAKRFLPVANKPENLGKTGVYFLHDGQEAFIARLAMIEKAEQSIDAQYYIWHDDVSGRLLLQSMYKAAQRGVRVRLLLDDNSTAGMDEVLTQFNSHPNIEVRLFNPYVQRKHRSIAYFTETIRINRRMHNKSFTADGVISVIGGRNIGDEYFEANNSVLFADFDVSVVGAVVPEIQQEFDSYWASPSSYPITKIAKANIKQARINQPKTQLTQSKFAQAQLTQNKLTQNKPANQNVNLKINTKTNTKISNNKPHNNPITLEQPTKSKEYLLNLFATKFPNYLANPNDPLEEWAKAHFFSDPADKAIRGRKFDYQDSVLAKITPFISSTKHQLLIVSPYFVPTPRGTQYLINMAKQGKRVIVSTNSLASTDVPFVHSGYKRYRKQLLQAGVEIYEFKPDPKNDEYGKQGYQEKYRDDYDVNGILPDSNASLHAKMFTSDNKYLFVGSPNFDPRSAMLNTEMGIVFESERMAKAVNKAFAQNKDIINYRLELTKKGKLEWHSLENGKKVIYHSEPHAEMSDKAFADVLSLIPLDGWL